MEMTPPEGYLALPTAGKGHPVLVLHAWWGLNAVIKALCDRLAQAGFVAFAADLYHGKVTDQIEEAGVLGAALDQNVQQARAEVQTAAAYVRERSGAGDSRVVVIGFSLGAYYALDLSARAPETVSGVVLFYGSGPADFSRSRAAYLGHFAENDPYESRENVDGLEKELRELGRPVTFHTYSGTGHWFFEPDRPDAYNAAAAALAWERTLDFLKAHFNA